jgi:uncharacterized membrane protein
LPAVLKLLHRFAWVLTFAYGNRSHWCHSVTDSRQSEELQQLRQQMAELTRRVFRLEQLLRTGIAVGSSPETSTAPRVEPAQPGPSPAMAQPSPTLSDSCQPAVLPDFHEQRIPQGPVPSPKADISLETRIGGQWLNRIGIIAVLVGLSYFLKLAIENNWIGPGMRVAIGLVAGIGLILWSERFRARAFGAFAYSLKAIGIGALYLSLWAAFQFYHLVPATVAFFAMVLVTASSAAMSLVQDSELLAAFALLGGFLTPVLVSTNQNHEIALFSYVALLDLGTVWVVAVRGWQRLLFGSFVGTALLFAAWASSYYDESQLATTLAFASLFFLLYAAAPFLGRKPAMERQYPNVMVFLTLLNAGSYFAASYSMLNEHHRLELAWLTVAVAALFFVLTRVLQTREASAHPLFGPLYLALGVGFLTIAIPLKLESYWNTLGWIVEGGALFWAAHRSGRMLLRILGAGAFSLGIARLITVDSFSREPLLINPRFGLYLLAIGALALLAYFTTTEGGEGNRQWAGAAIVGINVLALLALHFEVMGYFQAQLATAYSGNERHSIVTVREFAYSAVWMVYGSGLMLVGFWKRSAFVRWQAIVLLVMTVLKVFLVDIGTLERGYRIAAFIVLGAILLAVSFFYQRSRMRTAA